MFRLWNWSTGRDRGGTWFLAVLTVVAIAVPVLNRVVPASSAFHLSAYGMYGFAILSSMNYRQTMQFAEKYHQLATPLTELRFKEESGCGVWTITPMPHSRIDGPLYKFLVEMQFGICVLLRALEFMCDERARRGGIRLTANSRRIQR